MESEQNIVSMQINKTTLVKRIDGANKIYVVAVFSANFDSFTKNFDNEELANNYYDNMIEDFSNNKSKNRKSYSSISSISNSNKIQLVDPSHNLVNNPMDLGGLLNFKLNCN